MAFALDKKYSINITINGVALGSGSVFKQMLIAESVHQSLPTVDFIIVNDRSLIESTPLTDGSKIDFEIRILQNNEEEQFRLETVLWSHEVQDLSDGIQIVFHCVLSAPDFLEAKIESVDGSSFDVFNTVATRSGMTLISDSSIDKQVWIRPGIRGNLWLNEVINHSWASEKSAFVYAVTRERELLRYNLDERAAKDPTWVFNPSRENGQDPSSNTIFYKYPKFSSQSGFFNTFFGYGKELYSFNIETGERSLNKARSFVKRTNFMNMNEEREVPQQYGSLGFNNPQNIHEHYFDAFAQNMRIRSLYSVKTEVLSEYFRPVKLLDKVSLQLTDEGRQERPTTFAGHYFVDKIATMFTSTDVTRKFSLVREGFNADTSVSNGSK